MNYKLIGITSTKRSGKDTIADYLINNHHFQRYSFADPIKRGIMEMFGFTEEQMWGTAEDKETIDPRWGISPRRMLQLVGTELFQFEIQKHLKEGEFPIGREVWVNRFKIWFKEQLESKEREINFAKAIGHPLLDIDSTINIVISDVRFPHEAKAIREMGGDIWRVIRPSNVSEDAHASEKEQESIIADQTIMNDSTLNDLYVRVENTIKPSTLNQIS